LEEELELLKRENMELEEQIKQRDENDDMRLREINESENEKALLMQ
jgi:hypothetical protein